MESNQMSVRDIAQNLRDIKARLEQLRTVEKRLKEYETAYEDILLQHMTAQDVGMKTINFDDIGRFTVSYRGHAQIEDKELFGKWISDQIIKEYQEKGVVATPLQHLELLQQRASRAALQALEESGVDLASLGAKIVDKPVLSFTKGA